MPTTLWTPDQIPESQFEIKPSGYLFLDGEEVAHTLQCAHCGCHYVSIRGSGHIRGFCFKCNARTCGRMECAVCVPTEKMCEIEERGGKSILGPF